MTRAPTLASRIKHQAPTILSAARQICRLEIRPRSPAIPRSLTLTNVQYTNKAELLSKQPPNCQSGTSLCKFRLSLSKVTPASWPSNTGGLGTVPPAQWRTLMIPPAAYPRSSRSLRKKLDSFISSCLPWRRVRVGSWRLSLLLRLGMKMGARGTDMSVLGREPTRAEQWQCRD
ncbi:hypothetical protein J3F84DRAFT_258729 [Trichoderma pleuroticola]